MGGCCALVYTACLELIRIFMSSAIFLTCGLQTVPQNKNSEFCAPLTSFDWNETDPKRLGTSSIDTTCTIWDIEVPFENLMLPEYYKTRMLQ